MIGTKEELEELEKRIRVIEEKIVKIEKHLDWITGKLGEIPEKYFGNMGW